MIDLDEMNWGNCDSRCKEVLEFLEVELDDISYYPRMRDLRKITRSEHALGLKKVFVQELKDHRQRAGIFYKPFELLELWDYFARVNFDTSKLRDKLLEYYPLKEVVKSEEGSRY